MIHELGELHSSDGSTLLKMWKVSVQPGVRPLVRHSHIRFEITLITSGSGIYTVGDKEYPIKPDSIFVFASNEQHCVTKVDENGLEMINLHFEPRYLWGRSFDSLSNVNTNFCFQHSPNFENCIPADRARQICGLFTSAAEEFSKKKPEYALQIKSLLNMIIVALIRDFGYFDGALSAPTDKNRIIRKATEYLIAFVIYFLYLKPRFFPAFCIPSIVLFVAKNMVIKCSSGYIKCIAYYMYVVFPIKLFCSIQSLF